MLYRTKPKLLVLRHSPPPHKKDIISINIKIKSRRRRRRRRRRPWPPNPKTIPS